MDPLSQSMAPNDEQVLQKQANKISEQKNLLHINSSKINAANNDLIETKDSDNVTVMDGKTLSILQLINVFIMYDAIRQFVLLIVAKLHGEGGELSNSNQFADTGNVYTIEMQDTRLASLTIKINALNKKFDALLLRAQQSNQLAILV